MSLDGTNALVSDRYLISAVVDTGGTVAAGQVVYISNPGFIPAVLPTSGLSKGVLGVALTGGTAGKTITVICRGLVRVTASGSISTGQRIASDSSGQVQGVAAMAAPASDTYSTSAMQTQLDKTEQWIGRALTASSTAGTVIYALIYCIP